MELMLKIDLSDEQYDELMKTSYNKLFESDDFQKTLGNVIVENIGEWLRKNPDLIRQCLAKKGNGGYYNNYGNNYYDFTETAKVLIDKASEETTDKLTDIVSDVLMSCLKKDNFFESAIHTCLMEAILNGMNRGMDSYKQTHEESLEIIRNAINQTRAEVKLEGIHI